jgi:hypothetical protein
MTTLSTMIDEVSMNLSGYTLIQDRATHLISDVPVTASTVAAPITLALNSSESIGKGMLEIDEELFWVDSYDRVSNTATIPPYGRGYLGTTRAVHAAGTKVTISPTFPRFAIKRAINDTIEALGATIFAAASTTLTSNAATTSYRFPATGPSVNARSILSISYETIGASKEWSPIKSYRLDSNANTGAFTSGQTISIYDNIPAGRSVHVLYTADPTPFTSNAGQFESQTGLPNSCKDVVILGATYRLLSNLDPSRASMVSPQADETDSKRPYGSSQSVTKQIYALYSQRLNDELKNQQAKYPIRVHYSI